MGDQIKNLSDNQKKIEELKKLLNEEFRPPVQDKLIYIPIPEDSNKLELKRQIEEELKNLEKPVVKVNLINVEEAKSKLKNLQEEIIPLKENLKKEIKKKAKEKAEKLVKEKADKLAEAEEEEELERQRKKEKKLLDNLSKALDVVNKTKIEDAKKREEAKKIRRRSRKKNKRKSRKKRGSKKISRRKRP